MRKIWCYLFSIPVNKLCRGTGWKFSRRFQVNEQELHSQQFFKRRAQRRTCCTLHSKGTHGVIITSLLRQNDVTMSFWRNNVVVTCIMLCVHWDYSDICSVETFLILHAAVYVSLQQKQHHRSGPCITNVIATCRKNFSQWESSFLWKLRCHWLKFLRRVAKTLVIQGPALLNIYSKKLHNRWIARTKDQRYNGMDSYGTILYCIMTIYHKRDSSSVFKPEPLTG